MSLKFEDQPDEVQDRFLDKACEYVDGLFWCNRSWSAWDVHTMGADDFIEAAQDDDLVYELAENMWRFFQSELRGCDPVPVPLAQQELEVALDVVVDGQGPGDTQLWALSVLESYGVLRHLHSLPQHDFLGGSCSSTVSGSGSVYPRGLSRKRLSSTSTATLSRHGMSTSRSSVGRRAIGDVYSRSGSAVGYLAVSGELG